jgi:Putative metal-binding motif
VRVRVRVRSRPSVGAQVDGGVVFDVVGVVDVNGDRVERVERVGHDSDVPRKMGAEARGCPPQRPDGGYTGRRRSRRRTLRYPCRVRRLALVVVFILLGIVACGSHSVPDRLVVPPFDAGLDGASEVGPPESAPGNDDASPNLGAPCVDDGQCNDAIACTYDSCDRTAGRCLNVPDDTLCDDGNYCDGREKCVRGHGCQPGPVVSCSDGNPCHIAECVEATQSCHYGARDLDQDGDPDDHCMGGGDCNDLDPRVSSLHPEVCANGIDDNCNGMIDETPCVSPQGNSCATAIVAAGPGSYRLSTAGDEKVFSTSCSVTNPAAGQDVVAAVTVPPGPNVDLEVWATTNGVEVSAALQAVCQDPSSELACGSATRATSVRARARNVAPGTYYAVVTTQSPTSVELEVDLLAPTPPATNVDCASAAPIAPGTPTTVSIVNPPMTLPSACAASAGQLAYTGQLTYSFTLTQSQDVRVYASKAKGSGTPVIGLRSPACTGQADELSCRSSGSTPIYRRNLSPGTYVVTVAATSPIDASVLVTLAPPSVAPPDQTCASPPAAVANGTLAFDLSNHEDAIKDGCLPGGPNAAYDLALPSASDVLLIERFPQTDQGAVSLDPPDCASNLACSAGSSSPVAQPSPVRLGKRNVAAGDYRTVVTDLLGLTGTLDTLVRPTVAPTLLPPGSADTCAAAVDVSAGGFFTGDTSTAQADYANPCDAPTSPGAGAPDQVLALNLSQPQRVVLDMEGSSYVTILDVRQGPSCPGAPVAAGCYVGFSAQKSFLDLRLAAGQYWLLVDGYQQAAGAWNLDVRILPP